MAWHEILAWLLIALGLAVWGVCRLIDEIAEGDN